MWKCGKISGHMYKFQDLTPISVHFRTNFKISGQRPGLYLQSACNVAVKLAESEAWADTQWNHTSKAPAALPSQHSTQTENASETLDMEEATETKAGKTSSTVPPRLITGTSYPKLTTLLIRSPTVRPHRLCYPGMSDQLQQCQRGVRYHRHSPGLACTNPCQRRMEKHQHDSWSSRWWRWRLDSMQPCQTPVVTLKLSVISPYTRTVCSKMLTMF